MSGKAHITSIFQEYSAYTLDETPGGTPICVFSNPRGVPTVYAGGNGFVMSGGPGLIAHDQTSLDKFIADAEPLYDFPPAGLKTWKEAAEKLREKVNPQPQRLSA